MRSALNAALILSSSLVAAQPGALEKPLHVVLTLDHELVRDGKPQYMVISPGNDTLTVDDLRPATGDSVLSFMVHASSADQPWSVKYLPGGAMMDIHLQHDPSPLGTTLRLPFSQGAYQVNMRRVMKCLSDQADELGGNTGPWPVRSDTLACGGGRVVWSRSHGRAEVRLFDLQPFIKRMERMPPTSPREASYPGGMANFERFIDTHFSKPLIERTNLPTGQAGARVKLSALVTIETDGSIHQVHLNGSAYPELDREFKRVLQLSSWWEPAAVENIRNTNDPRSFRYIEQSKVIEYTVDPDSIWTELSEMSLTIIPTNPTSKDELSVTFHWIGGSCGRYEAYADVQSATEDGVRDVFLYFAQVPGELCCDIKPQSFGFTMKALPPGRYRFRQMPHPKLERGVWAPDPYRVRMVEVK